MEGAVSSAADAGWIVGCREIDDEEPDGGESPDLGALMACLQAGHAPACPAMLSPTRSDAPQQGQAKAIILRLGSR